MKSFGKKAAVALQSYSQAAHLRAQARKRLPPWLALLMPLVGMSFVLGIAVVFIFINAALYNIFHPTLRWVSASNPAQILMMLPALFGAIAPGLIIGNLALWLVPPIRQRLNRNAQGVPGLGLPTAMKGLLKATAIILPITLILSFIGAIDPWAD